MIHQQLPAPVSAGAYNVYTGVATDAAAGATVPTAAQLAWNRRAIARPAGAG